MAEAPGPRGRETLAVAMRFRTDPLATFTDLARDYGEDGWASVPSDGPALDACVAAIGEVVAGRVDSPCGVAFARDVVAVLASVAAATGQR